MTVVPLRSMLFIPGDSEKKLAKVAECGADAVILDLEDAVAPAAKPAVRHPAQETVSLEGKMIDIPHLKQAGAVLAQVDAAARR